MEKVIEKLKSDDRNLKLVAEALFNQCEKEPAFIDKILNEKKSLKDCWEYIKSKARKEAVQNCAVIDDQTVFGWAIHYFDEETLEDWKPAAAKVETKTDKPKAENEEPKPIKLIKPKKLKGISEDQLSLFDM